MSEEKIAFINALSDDEEMGICKCGEKATVRSYGGESGDYCFECYFQMLKRINGIE